MRSWAEVLGSLAMASVFFLALIAASIGVYMVLRRFHRDRSDRFVLFGISLVTGPILVAYYASLLFRLLPAEFSGRAYLLYPLVIIVLAGAAALLSARRLPAEGAAASPLSARKTEGWVLHKLGLAAAIVLIGGHVAMAVLSELAPVMGNDSVEYATTGRLIALFRSMEHFPFVNGEITGGFVAPFTHPPAHVTLIALAFLFQGSFQVDASDASSVKLIAAYFAAAHSVLLVAFAGWGGLRAAGFVAALLVLGSPMYALLTVENALDPMRIAAFTAAVAATWLLIRHQKVSLAILCGVACGCASFTHSIGLLTVGFALPAYLILAHKTPWSRRLLYSALIALITVAFVGPTLADNLQTFGAILQDRSPAWDVPRLRFDEFLAIARGLESPEQRLIFGLLRAFTEPQWMGYAFWLFAACAALGAIALRGPGAIRAWAIPEDPRNLDPVVISVLIVAGYYAMLTLSVLAETETAIKNPRYVMTVMPLAALVGARLLASYLKPLPRITPRVSRADA